MDVKPIIPIGQLNTLGGEESWNAFHRQMRRVYEATCNVDLSGTIGSTRGISHIFQDTDDAIVVKLEVRDVNAEDLELYCQESELIVRGGGVARKVWIPATPVDTSKAHAELSGGVLTVTLPKRASAAIGDESEKSVFDELLAGSPALRERWEANAPQRELAMALVGMRRKAGLTQKQLGELVGWDPGYVSRLESGRGPMPEPSTVQRYAEACGGSSSYVLIDKDGMPTAVRARKKRSAP